MRRFTAACVLATVAVLLLASSGGTRAVKEGGTFRVGISGFDSIDPALAGLPGYQLLQATCAGLLNLPDRPMPAGLRLVPEIAANYPQVSRDGKTFTFTIRSDFRFNTGARVTARDFAATINRHLNPAFKDFAPEGFLEIVGARRVLEGKARAASGVLTRGGKLVVRLLKPNPAFQANMAFCVLPASLPLTPRA
jgi:ABC-type transport system substrate-binding protein